MADFDEAGREDMQEKPAEEFLGMERGRATVLRPKRHGVVRDGDEPLVGETDAMGVAAEILEESFAPPKGRFT